MAHQLAPRGLTIEQKFLWKINKDDPSGCWRWTGKISNRGRGYGDFTYRDPKTGKPKTVPAHRYAYQIWVGPLIPGMHIDHVWPTCQHTDCVRPDHLEQVTPAENTRRYLESRTHCKNGHPYVEFGHMGTTSMRCRQCEREKGQRFWRANNPIKDPPPLKTHCKNGHEFTPENTRMGGKLGTTRLCKQCGRDRTRNSREKRTSH